MRYQTVFWDFDGTLANTGEDVWESVEFAAVSCNGHLSEAFRNVPSNLGRPMQDIFEAVVPFPGQELFETFQEQIRIHYRTMSEYPNTELYPGILQTLAWLKEQGIKSYIITMKPEEALLRILKKKGWEVFFDGCFSPDSFEGRERTKAELIGHLLRYQKMKPETVVYIGDTCSDVTAARKNGVDCIGVTYGDGDSEALIREQPEYVLHDAYGIRRILEEK